MVGSGQLALDAEGSGEIFPERGNELGAMVRFNGIWEAVEYEYLIEK